MAKDQKSESSEGLSYESFGYTVKKSKVKKSEALWLTSFSDLSLLLMCFFIMQLAYSNPDKRKYDNVKSAMHSMQAKKSIKN